MGRQLAPLGACCLWIEVLSPQLQLLAGHQPFRTHRKHVHVNVHVVDMFCLILARLDRKQLMVCCPDKAMESV